MLRRLHLSCFGLLAVITLMGLSPSVSIAQEPLHQRIDKLIAAAHTGPVAPTVNDAEYIRRLYLDLVGTIPTSDELRAFLADKSPNKRQALVDRLLADPRHATHLATVFDVMMMERRADKHVKAPEWQTYLQTSFAANKPYDQLAREILGAGGDDPKLRPAVKFYLDRDGETNLLTRDVGRVFFGKDLQCAQCHDHPLIDSYLQADYYGIFAFLNRSYVFADKKAKQSFFAEKAEGVTKFKSVFTGDEGTTGPRIPGGKEIVEPTFKKGEEYKVKPPKGGRGVPKFSRRAALAAAATSGTSVAFNRNIANRLWAHMMGRGLVHPVDLHHDDNPPTHPELLDALANELVAMKYDMRSFLRELALTQTYQRSIDAPGLAPAQLKDAESRLAKLKDEHKRLLAAVEQSKKQVETAKAELAAAEKGVAPANELLNKANAASAAAKKASDQASATLAASQKQLASKQEIAKVLAEAADKTQAAARLLVAEKDLADAAAKFAARSKQQATELAALSKTVATQAANAKAMADKLAAAQKAAADATAKVAAAKKLVDTVKQKLDGANAQHTSHKSAVQQTDQNIASAQKLVEYSQLAAAATASKAAYDKAQANLTAAKQAQQQAAAALPARQTELTAAQKANTTASTAAAASAKQLAAKQAEVKAVAEALAKANAALAKQPKDAAVVEAAAKVKATHDKLAAAIAPLQKSADAQAAAAKTAAAKLAAAQKAVNDLNATIAAQKQNVPKLETQLKPLAAKMEADRAAAASASAGVSEGWTKKYAVATLKPLSPEQLAWSIMQAAGVISRQRAAEEAALNKKTPLTDAIKNDPAKMAERNKQIELAVYNKLKGQAGQFVRLFGAGAGQPQQDFFSTVDQALFFANGTQVRGWLSPSGGSATQRAIAQEDPKLLTEELYMSILSRRPSPEEIADVTKYLSSRPKEEKAAVVQEIAWALVTSTEFRFSH